MTKKQMREITQLLLSAKYFFNLAKRRFNQLDQAFKSKKMADIASQFENSNWAKEYYDLLILPSDLSSCGIRISTLYEVMNIKPDNKTLYSTTPLDNKHICHFLRDNVCHREPIVDDKQYFKNRQDYIENLTVQELYDSVKDAFENCKIVITDSFRNYRQLQSLVNRRLKTI